MKNNRINIIRTPLIDNYIRIIKNLASIGRGQYQQYFIHPLSNWSKQTPVESIDRLMELLDIEVAKKGKKLPLLYKMSIIKSLAPDQLDLSIPGNISINFLKSMKDIQALITSDEALEFINILREPFKEFSDIQFKKMNKKFEEEIDTADTIEVENLIKSHEGISSQNPKINELANKHLLHIKDLLKRKNFSELRNQIILFLIRFSIPSEPDTHTPVFDIIDEISINHNSSKYKKEILDAAAIIIYDEILKSIKKGDLRKALKYIGRYTVIFRGNPKTPNYHEVDSFEKKFFNIIETKNLWDRL